MNEVKDIGESAASDTGRSVASEEGGSVSVSVTQRSRTKKGPTFFMIPLERWNTEHECSFHSKRIQGDNLFLPSLARLERTVSRSVPPCWLGGTRSWKLFTASPGHLCHAKGCGCKPILG